MIFVPDRNPQFSRLLQLILLSALSWLASCKTPPPPPPPPQASGAKPTVLYEWTGEDKPITHITINVDHQKAYLFSGKKEVGWTFVASGITSFPTPTGDFTILEKVPNKVSNLYGKGYDKDGKLTHSDYKTGRDLLPDGGRFEPAKMPLFMRLTGDGVGMHVGPIPRPGRRASHGCIRLPSKAAAIIYHKVAIGTPVSIVGTGPDYKTYLSQSAAKSSANAAKYAAAKKKAAEDAAAAKVLAESNAIFGPSAAGTPVANGTPASPAAPSTATSSPTVVEQIKPAIPASIPPSPNPGS